MRKWMVLGLATAVSALALSSATTMAGEEEEEYALPEAAIIIPVMNPEHGRKLFAEKGCVICHSINGVGGHDAISFDEESEFKGPINPFHVAAKMWQHAPEMIPAQQEELGKQIELDAQDLADIIAFLASPDLRKTFSEDMVPERIRKAIEND